MSDPTGDEPSIEQLREDLEHIGEDIEAARREQEAEHPHQRHFVDDDAEGDEGGLGDAGVFG